MCTVPAMSAGGFLIEVVEMASSTRRVLDPEASQSFGGVFCLAVALGGTNKDLASSILVEDAATEVQMKKTNAVSGRWQRGPFARNGGCWCRAGGSELGIGRLIGAECWGVSPSLTRQSDDIKLAFE